MQTYFNFRLFTGERIKRLYINTTKHLLDICCRFTNSICVTVQKKNSIAVTTKYADSRFASQVLVRMLFKLCEIPSTFCMNAGRIANETNESNTRSYYCFDHSVRM